MDVKLHGIRRFTYIPLQDPVDRPKQQSVSETAGDESDPWLDFEAYKDAKSLEEEGIQPSAYDNPIAMLPV